MGVEQAPEGRAGEADEELLARVKGMEFVEPECHLLLEKTVERKAKDADHEPPEDQQKKEPESEHGCQSFFKGFLCSEHQKRHDNDQGHQIANQLSSGRPKRLILTRHNTDCTMAERGLRVIGAAPAGPEFCAVLQKLVKPDTFVTSFDDGRFRAAKAALYGQEVDFVPFIELVGRFLMMMGQTAGVPAKATQLEALTAHLCEQLDSENPYYDAARHPGTHQVIAKNLSTLRLWGSNEDDLRDIAAKASPDLSERLNALADLQQGSRQFLEDLGREFPSHRVLRCMDHKMSHVSALRHIVVLMGAEEKPVWERWLAWLADQGVQVDCIVDWRASGEPLFASSRRMASRMGRKIVSLFQTPAWHDALFTSATAESAPNITVASAPDPLAEAEWAIRGCLELRQEGIENYDIAIFARDAETYSPLLKAASVRLGVPLNIRISQPLMTNGFAKTALQTLRALTSNDVRNIYRLSKSSYFPQSAGSGSMLWNAVSDACRDPESQWRSLKVWAIEAGEEFEWLVDLLNWREEAISQREPLSAWLARLRDLFAQGSTMDLVAKSPTTRTRDTRAMTVLQGSLADCAFVSAGAESSPLDLWGFVRVASRLWDNETLVLDGDANGVNFISNTAALASYHTVFVLGMLEGSLPRRRSEQPLLSDMDLAELKEITRGRIDIPDSHAVAAAEREEFVRICSAAAKNLIFSCPQTAEEKDNVPAFYLEEVRRAAPAFISNKVYARSELAPAPNLCRSPADLRLAKALELPISNVELPHLTSDEATAIVCPKPTEPISPREIQEVLICPFQSGVRHRLHVRGPHRQKITSLLNNLPKRVNLVECEDENQARWKLELALKDRLSELYPELEEWEVKTLQSAGKRMIEEWVAREFQAREFWPRDPGSFVSSPRFGEYDLQPEFPVPGGMVKFQGGYAARYTSNGQPVFFDYQARAPKGIPQTSDDEPVIDAEFVEVGIGFLAQHGIDAEAFCFEVDFANGKRVIYVTPHAGEPPLKPKKRGDVMLVKIPGTRRSPVIKAIHQKVKQAVSVLRRSDLTPKPGSHCEYCVYGELCRSSSEFGETNDILEGGED